MDGNMHNRHPALFETTVNHIDCELGTHSRNVILFSMGDHEYADWLNGIKAVNTSACILRHFYFNVYFRLVRLVPGRGVSLQVSLLKGMSGAQKPVDAREKESE
jgi:hypothetical protein